MNLYTGLIRLCVTTTVVLTAAFAMLVVRRWILERRAPLRAARQQAITRNYLQRVGGLLEDPPAARWAVRQRLGAVGHLLLLLRGGDRDRLIQLAELDGLFDAALRQTSAMRAARRIDATRILQQLGGEAAVAKLREMLSRDPHRIVRLNAAFSLASFGRLPPPRETMRLLDMPGRAPTPLDIAILRALAPEYSDHLVLMLGETMPHSRRAAIIDALGWSKTRSVLPTLRRAAGFDDVEVRCAALRAAARLGQSSAAPWIVRALDDSAGSVRIQAVNSCSALGLHQAIPALQALTCDANIWVRLRAEQALLKLAPAADPALVRLSA